MVKSWLNPIFLLLKHPVLICFDDSITSCPHFVPHLSPLPFSQRLWLWPPLCLGRADCTAVAGAKRLRLVGYGRLAWDERRMVAMVETLAKFPYGHRIHGAGIYANIWGILMVNVRIYTSTMDPSWDMGFPKFMGVPPSIFLRKFEHFSSPGDDWESI